MIQPKYACDLCGFHREHTLLYEIKPVKGLSLHAHHNCKAGLLTLLIGILEHSTCNPEWKNIKWCNFISKEGSKPPMINPKVEMENPKIIEQIKAFYKNLGEHKYHFDNVPDVLKNIPTYSNIIATLCSWDFMFDD